MKLLKMDGPQCLLYSMAMLLDAEPEDLQREIGHTGLEEVFSGKGNSRKERGFHPQEFILPARKRRILLTSWEVMPTLGDGIIEIDVFTEVEARANLSKILELFQAVLIGEYKGKRHSATWDNESKRVFDPNGFYGNLDDYDIQEIVFRIKSFKC